MLLVSILFFPSATIPAIPSKTNLMALLHLEIIRREAAATDAIILYFKEVSGVPVYYEAGQFLTFILHIQERELRRSYSLASTFGVDEYPFVVIKRLANGEVSRHDFKT